MESKDINLDKKLAEAVNKASNAIAESMWFRRSLRDAGIFVLEDNSWFAPAPPLMRPGGFNVQSKR